MHADRTIELDMLQKPLIGKAYNTYTLAGRLVMGTIELNNGNLIPSIGFGTWKVTPDSIARAVVTLALQAGYRLIDTATIYRNEIGVGEAINGSGIPRDEIFVTTKLWNSDQGYESAFRALENSLHSLQLKYVDLYLIHWPAHRERRKESWKAMEKMYKEGTIKNIGVSNYTVKHLEELLSMTSVPVNVNQIEFHPFIYKSQLPILEFCQKNGIAVEAYSPLSSASQLRNLQISSIAQKRRKTNAQIMLRWAIQHGTIPLPRSTDERHIEQNIDVYDFELSEEDMEILDSLYDGSRVAPDPFLMD